MAFSIPQTQASQNHRAITSRPSPLLSKHRLSGQALRRAGDVVLGHNWPSGKPEKGIVEGAPETPFADTASS